MSSFLQLVFLWATLHGLYTTIVLLTKIRKNRANIYSTIIVFLLTLHLSVYYFNYYDYFVLHFKFIFDTFLFVSDLQWAPLLYFYFNSLLTSRRQKTSIALISFVPFILIFAVWSFLLMSLISGVMDDSEKIKRIIEIIAYISNRFISQAMLLAVCIMLFRKLRMYNRKLKQYSSKALEINSIWITLWMVVLAETIIVLAVTLFISNTVINVILYYHFSAIYVLSIFVVKYFSDNQSELFNEQIERKLQLLERRTETTGNKTEKNLVNADEVLTFIKESRIYLQPELSIADLARELSMPAYQLSEFLNTVLHKNFYQIINALRVDEAFRLLTDEQSADLNILEIALRAGFNTKNTFNRIFKQHTGITPREYRIKKQNKKNK